MTTRLDPPPGQDAGGRYKLSALRALSEVAAQLTTDADLEGLLSRYLSTMNRLAGAHAGTVRVLSDDGAHMRLVASVGLPPEVVDAERLVPADCGVCGQALSVGSPLATRSLAHCASHRHHPFFDDCAELYAVPIRQGADRVGAINLFLRRAGSIPDEVRALFSTIGDHLGMALENARLMRESTRASLASERQMLANQVHDALAQTIAYARMRLSALRTALAETDTARAERYLDDLDDAMRSAYGELRGLIHQFRQPIDPRGLIATLRAAIDGFARRSGIAAEFTGRAPDPGLAPDEELQVFHIVQEALANAHRHGGATRVRVSLELRDGEYHVCVEDNGRGFDPASAGRDGDHFGLGIMRERAERLDGRIDLESQPGTGSRTSLIFPTRSLSPPGHAATARRTD